MIKLGAMLWTALFFFAGTAHAHEAPSTPEEKQAYIDNHLEFVEAEARWLNHDSEDREPGVRFAVKNHGSETLTQVTVVVYFLDNNGLPFAEEDFNAVSRYSDTKLLKPNYIQRLPKNRYYTIDNLGDDWSGKAKFEIVEIEFAK